MCGWKLNFPFSEKKLIFYFDYYHVSPNAFDSAC